LLPNATSNIVVEGVPVVVVSERRYDPAVSPLGSVATTVPVLELKLTTVSWIPSRLTVGVPVPTFTPTIVILFDE
jgi:hypothetical protein